MSGVQLAQQICRQLLQQRTEKGLHVMAAAPPLALTLSKLQSFVKLLHFGHAQPEKVSRLHFSARSSTSTYTSCEFQ